MEPESHRSREHVLVFLPNRGFFGASLTVIPTLLALRARHPGLPIIGLTPCPQHRCYLDWGLIEEFHYYPKPWCAGLLAPIKRTFQGRAAQVVNMRPGAEWVQMWSWMVPAAERSAFSQGFGRVIARHHVPYYVNRYRPFNYLSLLPGDPGLRAGDLLAGWAMSGPVHPAPDGSRTLVLLPSGGGESKLWPLESYGAIAKAWLTGMGDRVVVIAGPREQAVCQWFASQQLTGLHLETGTPLADQITTIRTATAVVHNDCGPGHFAQLLDVPRVALFPEWGQPQEWFRPGLRARCLQAPPGQPMASISVASVLAELRLITA